jgi:hypothetical protein
MHAMVTDLYIRGAHFPLGGEQMLAATLLEVLRANGGEFGAPQSPGCATPKSWGTGSACVRPGTRRGSKSSTGPPAGSLHCYGHSGFSVSQSWGSAREIESLCTGVREAVSR